MPETVVAVFFVQGPDPLEMTPQRIDGAVRQNRHAVLFALALPDEDLAHRKIDILDAKAKALDLPQTAPVDDNGDTYLTLTFRRRTGGAIVTNTWQVDGIICRVEVGSDLQAANWDSDATMVEWVSPANDNGDGTETVSCRLKTPVDSAGDHYFIRLGVEEAP